MDALKIDRAHVVGHSMGASTALHVGIRHAEPLHLGDGRGLRLRLERGSEVVEERAPRSRETAKMFAENTMADSAAKYGDGATRQAHKNKDPRGYARFVKMLSEHSPLGHSLIMANLQAKRPTLWDMQADLKKFAPPLLIIVGDEDDWCLDASVFLRRAAPTAGLVVVPRTGHTLTSEEPEKFNTALAEFFAEAERGTLALSQAALTDQ